MFFPRNAFCAKGLKFIMKEFANSTKSSNFFKKVTTDFVYRIKHFVPKIFNSVNDVRWMCHHVRNVAWSHDIRKPWALLWTAVTCCISWIWSAACSEFCHSTLFSSCLIFLWVCLCCSVSLSFAVFCFVFRSLSLHHCRVCILVEFVPCFLLLLYLCIALSPRLYLHSRSSVTAPSSLFGLSFMQVSSAVSPIFLLSRFLSLTLSYVSALAQKCSSGSDIRLGGFCPVYKSVMVGSVMVWK